MAAKTISLPAKRKNAWDDRNIREKITSAIAEVEREYRAGRLKWCKRDVRRLIWSFPRKACDDVLENQCEHASLMATVTDGPDNKDETENEADDELDDELDDAHAPNSPTVVGEPDGVEALVPYEIAAGTAVAPVVHKDVATAVARSTSMVKVYKDAVQSLKSCGAISAATQLEGEMRTEQRRQRNLQKGNPSLAAAFQYQRDLETLAHIKETQRVREANSVTKALADTKSNLQEANRQLRKRKAELLNAESLL